MPDCVTKAGLNFVH